MDKTRERGSAQINIELKDGIITVRHTHPLGDILYTKDAKPGDWDKIWEAIKPTTFDVCSSHGTLTVNRNNGEVLHWNCNEELNHILKFDMVEYLTALKKAHEQLHKMCDMYCRDKNGALNHEPGGWDADLDIEIQNIINNVNKTYGTEQNSDAIH